MRNSQQVCKWIKKYRNDTFRSNKKLSKFFYMPYVVWKMGILINNIENSHFLLQILTAINMLLNHQKFQLESDYQYKSKENNVYNLWNMLKTLFYQKIDLSTQISERSTFTLLHHSQLDSGGQRYLEMTKNNSAYAKTTCWNSNRLFDFVKAIKFVQYCCNHLQAFEGDQRIVPPSQFCSFLWKLFLS